ncbi:hypothetical protein FOCC_FOCC012812 [Frankliniella occidentalis]|nr:hypothetical protein FOCC_FOCC012812 [Frankliniella occidentalis]
MQQAANRDLERPETTVVLDLKDNEINLASRHLPEDEIIEGEYFKFLSFFGFKFQSDDASVVDYDVGLESWLISAPDEEMNATITWPENSALAGPLIRQEKPPKAGWNIVNIVIKRFYATYQEALAGCNSRIIDTNYETDHPDNAKIKKRRPARYESGASSTDGEDGGSKQKLPNKCPQKRPTKKMLKPALPPPALKSVQKERTREEKHQGKTTLDKPFSGNILKTTNLSQEKNNKLANSLGGKGKKSSIEETIVSGTSHLEDFDMDMDNSIHKDIPELSPEHTPTDDAENIFKDLEDNGAASSIQEPLSEHENYIIGGNQSSSVLHECSSVVAVLGPVNNTPQDNNVITLPSTEQLHDLATKMNTFQNTQEKMQNSIDKLGQKIDRIALSLAIVQRHTVPGEKYLKTPKDMPTLPVDSLTNFQKLENSLDVDDHLSALVG